VVHYLFCCLFVLSVILRLTTSDYNLGISNLFLQYIIGRKTHNTMVKEKKVKMINNDLQNTTQKTKIQHRVPHLIPRMLSDNETFTIRRKRQHWYPNTTSHCHGLHDIIVHSLMSLIFVLFVQSLKTYNTMVKEKKVKMINNNLQNTTQKTKIQHRVPHWIPRMLRCPKRTISYKQTNIRNKINKYNK
jgi:hypothetical protein